MPRSYLAKYQPQSVWDGDRIEREARKAWLDHGILLIRVADEKNDIDRNFLISYGRRKFEGKCQ